jgi:hypothetical protein
MLGASVGGERVAREPPFAMHDESLVLQLLEDLDDAGRIEGGHLDEGVG